MSLLSMAASALVYNGENVIGDAAAGVTNFVSSVFNAPPGSPAAFAGGQQMRYPMDLPQNYNINFQFVKYQRRSILDQPSFPRVGGVQLPIPVNLLDSQSITWEGTSSDPVVGAAIENGLQEYQQGGGNASLASVVKSAAIGGLAGAAVNLVDLATNKITNALGISGNLTDQGYQLLGLAQNPFLTMLFKSPTFKTHSFSWRFAPRTPQESNAIVAIIQTFKINALPALQPGTKGVFLSYPNLALITLTPSYYLYQFKPCAITNISVNYAGGGVPSFFHGTNAPTIIDFRVDLQEIEYWLRDNILSPNSTNLDQSVSAPSPTSSSIQPSAPAPISQAARAGF